MQNAKGDTENTSPFVIAFCLLGVNAAETCWNLFKSLAQGQKKSDQIESSHIIVEKQPHGSPASLSVVSRQFNTCGCETEKGIIAMNTLSNAAFVSGSKANREGHSQHEYIKLWWSFLCPQSADCHRTRATWTGNSQWVELHPGHLLCKPECRMLRVRISQDSGRTDADNTLINFKGMVVWFETLSFSLLWVFDLWSTLKFDF